jgi:hypothetical protein
MADVQIPKVVDIRELIVHIKAELRTLRKLLKIADQAGAAESFSAMVIPRAIDIRERIAHMKAELRTLHKLLKIVDQAEAAESFSDVDGPVFCDKAPPGSPMSHKTS